jgi:heme/copper-type cytochrome/quinol oxidase subunit 4
MTNRTNTYYTVRSIVRFLVKLVSFALVVTLTALAFIGVHAAAASIWTALALAAALWLVYFAFAARDRRKLAN